MTRGQRGRSIGRVLIAIAYFAIGVTLFGFIAAPGTMGPPMFGGPPDLLGLPVGVVLALTGIAGVIVGLIWMIRIHRGDPEPDQHAWRYRSRGGAAARRSLDRADGPVRTTLGNLGGVAFGVGMTRGQRGRWIGRGMIAIACLAIGLTVLLLIAAPGTMASPMFGGPPFFFGLPVDVVLTVTGIVGPVVGLTWMIRIHRADPEPDQHAWRYRSRDR